LTTWPFTYGIRHPRQAADQVVRRRVGDPDEPLHPLARVEEVRHQGVGGLVGDGDLAVTVQDLDLPAAGAEDLAEELDVAPLDLHIFQLQPVELGVPEDVDVLGAGVGQLEILEVFRRQAGGGGGGGRGGPGAGAVLRVGGLRRVNGGLLGRGDRHRPLGDAALDHPVDVEVSGADVDIVGRDDVGDLLAAFGWRTL
jgi:hypothetical protein